MILGISLGAAFLATITASLTWFDNRVNLKPSIDGGSAAAYFAYGRGKQGEPYGITTPRHLYNLAWLQYLGEFDSNTTYFELAADINMSSSPTIKALPPIGNSEHPFTGQFTSKTGETHTISKLTISNSYSDFGITPYSVTNTNYTSDNIVGMFGVVGDPTQKTNPETKINHFYLDSPTIKSTNSQALAGIVAGYVNAEISSVGVISPKMSFPTTDNPTSPLQTVTFKKSDTDSGTTKTFSNVSDYSVVGYCEDAYKSSISSSVTTLKNSISYNTVSKPNGSGEGQKGWGGSVDMKTMFTDVAKLRDAATKPVTYVKSTDKDGKITESAVQINTYYENDTNGIYENTFRYKNYDPSIVTDSDNISHWYSYYKTDAKDSNNKINSQFTFTKSSKNDDKDFIGLTGEAERYIQSGNTITTISDSNINKKKATFFYQVTGTDKEKGKTKCKFLKVQVNGSNVSMSAVDDQNSASFIILDPVKDNENEYKISTTIGNTTYYLKGFVDKGNNIVTANFEKGDSGNNIWVSELYSGPSAFYLKGFNNQYFALSDDGNTWGIRSTYKTYKLKANNTESYFEYVDRNTTNVVTENDATIWFIDSNNGAIYLNLNSSGSGNVVWYLGAENLDNGGNIKVNKDYNSRSFHYDNNKTSATYQKIFCTNGTKNYYLTLDSSNKWSITKNSSDAIQFYLQENSIARFPFHIGGPNSENNQTEIQQDSQFNTQDTFFPLMMDSSNPGVPLENNTGYVVSGSDYVESFSGDIRISKYLKTGDQNGNDLSNSIGADGRLSDVYTIDTSGNVSKISESNTFVKYAHSREEMDNILGGTDNNDIYGIHFMNAKIGKDIYGNDKRVIIPSGYINNQQITNYEVPDDCIDFKLDEEGYINFFAGTYFPNNNCFFSLYKVERDSNNKITDLKKIKAVYSALNSVSNGTTTYKFSDGWKKSANCNVDFQLQFDGETSQPTWTIEKSNSTGEGTTTKSGCKGTLAFDIDKQLGNQGNQFSYDRYSCAFYFEIPVPAGEYALGSVDGGIGAYLMYLDIGTNAKLEVSRTTIIDSMTTTIETTKTFMGVSIVSAATTSASYNSYCIVLKNGINGDVQYKGDTTISSGSVTINSSVYKDSDTLIQVSFKKGDYKVSLSTTNGTTTNTKDATIDSTINPISTKTIKKERVSLYDYYDANQITNILEVTKTTTKEGEKESTPKTEYKKTQKDKDWKDTSTTDFTFKDKFNIDDINTTNNEFISDFLKDYASEISAVNAQTTPAFSYSMQSEILGNIQIDFTPILTLNKQNQYEISGYSITITPLDSTTQGTIIISSATRNNNTYTITINNVDTGEQETITITVPQS